MLGVVGAKTSAPATQAMGLVPTLTHVGLRRWASFSPRRWAIATTGATLILMEGRAMLVAGAARSGRGRPTVGTAAGIASLAMGVAASLAQDIVPAAATLAP